jgi:hypothetical protein
VRGVVACLMVLYAGIPRLDLPRRHHAMPACKPPRKRERPNSPSPSCRSTRRNVFDPREYCALGLANWACELGFAPCARGPAVGLGRGLAVETCRRFRFALSWSTGTSYYSVQPCFLSTSFWIAEHAFKRSRMRWSPLVDQYQFSLFGGNWKKNCSCACSGFRMVWIVCPIAACSPARARLGVVSTPERSYPLPQWVISCG